MVGVVEVKREGVIVRDEREKEERNEENVIRVDLPDLEIISDD